MSDTHGERPHACTNCSRAKARCVWLDNDDEICQRCSKSNLSCSRAHAVSKRRRGKATHSKVLEKKLDDIMSVLTRDERRASSTARYGDYQSASQMEVDQLQPGSIFILPGFHVPDADAVLSDYTENMTPEFPFVPLPSQSSSQMLEEKPLLTKTILFVCRPPPPEVSSAFETWFRETIAHEAVVLGNKNIELVQAILVFLAWKDVFFYAAGKDTTLLQLAICLVEDLGLTRPPKTGNSTFESIVEDAAELRNETPPQQIQTHADRRTLLGVFYLTSTLCCLLGRRYRLQYTPHFDYCCQQLLNDRVCRHDVLLVHLVRIQKIAMKVNDSFREIIDNTSERSLKPVYSMFASSIENELHEFDREMPARLEGSHLLQTHYAAVLIRLLEPFYHGGREGMLGPTPAHLRCRRLWGCLQSTQEMYEGYVDLLSEKIPFYTFVPILHAALATFKTFRLLWFKDEAWDLDSVRERFDLPGSLQLIMEYFEDANRAGHPRCQIMVHGRPIFSEYAEVYRAIERGYEAKVNAEQEQSSPTWKELLDECQDDASFWPGLFDLTDVLGS